MHKDKLSKKIVIALFLTITFVTFITLTTVYTLQEKHINEISIEEFEDVSNILMQTIKKDTQLFKGLNELLQKDENTISLVQEKNREWLFLYLFQTYQSFEEKYDITHFYIHNTDKTNLVRIHDREMYSDRIKRLTLDKASETLLTTSGIEFSMNHNFTLRVVSPFFDRGDLIGYIELGEEIDNITNQIADIHGLNIILTINKNIFSKKDYDIWRDDNLNNEKYTELNNFYIANSTLAKISLNKKLKNVLDSKKSVKNIRVYNDEIAYNVNSKPFYDFAGKEVGKLYVINNVTNDIQELRVVIFRTLSILIIIIIITVYFFYRYINKINSTIDKYMNKIEFNYKFEQYINHISKYLIYNTDIDIGINKALEELGITLGAHRAYLFKFKDNYKIMDNTHEWCAPGVNSELKNLHNEPTKDFQWWLQKCKDLKPIVVEDINNLPKEAQNEKQSLVEQNIRSLLVYPIAFEDKTIGFVGVDMVLHQQKWSKTHHSFVKITAKSIADMFERRLFENELQLSAKVFENSLDGIIITDADTNIIKTNDSFSKITGYSKNDLVGKKPSILKSNWHDKEFYENMWKELKDKSVWEGEIKDRRENGELYVSFLTIIMIQNSDGHITNYIGISRDITDLKKTEEHIRSLAFYDPLTSLPNRTLFYDRLEQSIQLCDRNKGKMALLFIDLDSFKATNDTHGHHMGDVLLQSVAKILTGCIRKSDTVSRLGGDEFTVILRKIHNKDDVTNIANKIITELSKTITINNISINIGCSIGAAIYPNDTQNAQELIKMADNAMYKAKTNGKNHLRFYE
ncbi:diguanylate cyclase [Sulfurimonas lithotrophica]|uniref:Diguanylate cyclase n=1 Tax=Sulfurimonas lithotrophica TaxID=2590022 RepID=A0A5P8P450_9BACT|nr:diguanylate cyclase [Sulfurimonas lithotrophica]QFR50310.1 diguanylate cyclase [Sulfurimonas lithotrophica]